MRGRDGESGRSGEGIRREGGKEVRRSDGEVDGGGGRWRMKELANREKGSAEVRGELEKLRKRKVEVLERTSVKV